MIKNFLRGLNKGTAFILAALLGLGTVAFAAAVQVPGTGYSGYNPVTGVAGYPGVDVAYGGPAYATTSNSSGTAVPALVVTGTSCAATTPVIGGTLGTGTITTGTGTATCTYTITNLPTVNTGYICIGVDATTPADVLVQSAVSVNGCTLTQSAKVSGDTIVIFVTGV
jgi:hypothetical protein